VEEDICAHTLEFCQKSGHPSILPVSENTKEIHFQPQQLNSALHHIIYGVVEGSTLVNSSLLFEILDHDIFADFESNMHIPRH
jgi:hypothetical protein